MSYRRIALSVGVFIIISSVLILISLFYVIDRKGVFETQVYYQLLSTNAEEIEEGMPILFSGFEIGQVDKLSLYANGEVLIHIKVSEHNTKWIRSDAVFVLEKPLIGKSKITLTSSMSQAPLNKKSILRMQIKDGINEVISDIQPVIADLQNIVRNINAITLSLADKNASFQSSLQNIESFSGKLSDSTNLTHAFTGNAQSSKDLHASIATLKTTLHSIDSLAKNTDTGISEIRSDVIKPTATNMQELELILKDIRSKLKELDGTVTVVAQSDKDIVYFKDEMRILLDEVTELSTRVNTIIGDNPQENIDLP